MSTILAKDDGTTLKDHTNALFICYGNWLEQIQRINPAFYERVKQWDNTIRDVLFFHDQGKLLKYFQQTLKGKKVDYVYHELISIALISRAKRRSWGDCAPYAQRAIALHHNRTKDELDKAWRLWDEQIASLKDDYAKNPDDWKDLKESGRWDNLISTAPCNDLLQEIEYDDDYKLFTHVFFKGMLHKCDYAASAGLNVLEKPYVGNFIEGFNRITATKTLSPLQVEAAKLSNKSVILIAPTGSGKTELAMNWVRKDSDCKVFYLLGMRTAVNKMYERWHTAFEDNVELLHGEISYQIEDNDSDRLEMIRKLSIPITIATADQLVTSTLKYPSFETVYLTCAYSQIIVDEIQSFNPQAMAIIVFFLKEIHNLGGRFMLMTATLPPFIQEELMKLGDVALLDPLGDKNCHKSRNMHMVRHRFEWLENSHINSDESIAHFIDSYNSGKSVLAICNTVTIAQNVMTKLKDKANAHLLHARFTRADRKAKEEKISGKEPVIWVSTQIVEASLDIDFDEMHTEICTIDSLLQRFGRCYRNRDYTADEPNIFIYNYNGNGDPKNYTETIYDKELLERTKEQIKDYTNKSLTEEDKYKLFNAIFSNLDSKYIDAYNDMIKKLNRNYKADSRTKAQDIFRDSGMLNYNLVPQQFQQQVEGCLESWRNADKHERTKIQAEIMEYTVSAPAKNGIIPVPNPKHSKFIANLYFAPEILYTYDAEIGLQYLKKDEPLLLA